MDAEVNLLVETGTYALVLLHTHKIRQSWFYLRSIVYADLNKSALLVVQDTVVSVFPVPVVVELHSPCETLGVFR